MREWLDANLTGPFAGLRGAGGPGREPNGTPIGWPGTGTWPRRAGPAWAGPPSTAAAAPRWPSRSSSTRSTPGPARRRAPIVGEELLGPTLIAFGTRSRSSASCRRSGPSRSCGARATPSPAPAPTWPAVATKAARCRGTGAGEWVITGQKVWTSLAHVADWCFVLARTEPGSPAQPGPVLPAGPDAPAGGHGPPDPAAHRHLGVQRGLLRRRAHRAANVVGAPGDGWRVAKATLAIERGAALPSFAARRTPSPARPPTVLRSWQGFMVITATRPRHLIGQVPAPRPAGACRAATVAVDRQMAGRRRVGDHAVAQHSAMRPRAAKTLRGRSASNPAAARPDVEATLRASPGRHIVATTASVSP